MSTLKTVKKILFISHDASRTGAPIVLLHLLRWLKAHSDLEFQIMLRKGGVLESDFCGLAPAWNIEAGISGYTGWMPRGSGRIGLRKFGEKTYLRRLKARLQQEDFSLVYANTVTNGDILEFLSDFRCPVLCHVHELEYGIRHFTDAEKFTRVKEYTHHYIVVSEAVRQNLVANHGVPADRIDIVYEFIPASASREIDHGAARSEILQRWNIPADARIVAASGTLEWRKGPDLFVQLARSICARRLPVPVHFMWVGGESDGPYLRQLMHDINHAGVGECVHFLGSQPDPLTYFAACDVFAMISREDPFPLVSLEAASLGKPVVCFDGSGGAKEFVADDCGYVVSYLDVESMAAKVEQLLVSPGLRERFGRRAVDKVRERHDVSIGAAQILSIINRFL